MQDLGLTVMVFVIGIAVWQLAERLAGWGVPVIGEAAIVAGIVSLLWAPLARAPIRELIRERRARSAGDDVPPVDPVAPVAPA